jgi:hypothetical protein
MQHASWFLLFVVVVDDFGVQQRRGLLIYDLL